MIPVRVNADYESELFLGKPGPRIVNESLEFIAFYLEARPVYTTKEYTSDYFDHVEKLVGKRPTVTRQTPFENWWGPLEHLAEERWFNSKVTSAELIESTGWCPWTRVIASAEELADLDSTKTYLLKDPFGMSGQRVQVNRPSVKVVFPVVAEPFFQRRYDFGTYVWPDGRIMHYENFVDERFQYKGTLFTDWTAPTLANLSFYQRLAPAEWERFARELKVVLAHYARYPNRIGYSVDSFVYEENGALRIRTLCEVNYRRTMGRVTYELAERFGSEKKCAQLSLVPVGTEQRGLRLSPGDTRFDLFFDLT